MVDKREIKSLEEDLLWEVEINASNAELISKLILPNEINSVSTSIVTQLKNVTKSKYCFAGCLDPETDMINYIICLLGGNQKENIYSKKIAMDAHSGSMGKIIEKRKALLKNNAKETNGSWISILGKDIVARYVIAPVIVEKDFVGQIGVLNASHNYTERELMFVRRLANIFALAIQQMNCFLCDGAYVSQFVLALGFFNNAFFSSTGKIVGFSLSIALSHSPFFFASSILASPASVISPCLIIIRAHFLFASDHMLFLVRGEYRRT